MVHSSSKCWVLLLAFWLPAGLAAQSAPLSINANVEPPTPRAAHLKMGGANPAGDSIGVNNYFFTRKGQPFVPVTGEFHYPRYPRAYWDESLKKMKAGGVNTVATYVFWNVHEELQGQFDWTGDRDLRHFVQLCQQNGLSVLLRIGPFGHGEIRSGGLPDWLLGSPLTIRSNDPAYLACVQRFYRAIGQQVQGLFYQNNGPIVGVQLENEYQHSAAPWGLTYPGQPYDWTAAEQDRDATHQGVSVAAGANPYADLGNEHLRVLKALAIEAGLAAPLYTATGWGYAAVIPNETVPVTAAYAYPFWTEKKDLSPFFLYQDLHHTPDYAPVRYVPEDYPAFPAELGSGIMSVYSRRPVVEQRSMDALINRCLGSGANGIGYYMFHGGSTPRGRRSFLNDEAYGLPKISYDFQAPIGEYGQLRESYHRLRLLHYFTRDFGHLLAPMVTVLPEQAARLTPDNLRDLRYAVRVKDGRGFLFVNNFQDDATCADQTQRQIRIATRRGEVLVPESGGFDLKSGENAIFPFNFDLDGATLIYATAQLFTRLGDENAPRYVFFAPEGVSPEFSVAAQKGLKITADAGATIEQNKQRWRVRCQSGVPTEFRLVQGKKVTTVLVVSKALAEQCWQVNLAGTPHLLFTPASVWQDGDALELRSKGLNSFKISAYPRVSNLPIPAGGTAQPVADPLFSTFEVLLPVRNPQVTTRSVSERKWQVVLPTTLDEGLSDLFLTVNYVGDTGMAFLKGDLVADDFYKGIPWEMGLKRFYREAAPGDLVLYFRPLQRDATFLPDLRPEDVPDFGQQKEVLQIRSITLTPEYRCRLRW